VSPSLSILSVPVARVINKSIVIPISLRESQKNREPVELEALLDSGAGGLFIDAAYAKENDFTLHDLPEPLNAYNVYRTKNKKGMITSCVEIDLQIGDRIKSTRLYVTGLGKQKVILGFPWLQDENPDVNWKTGEMKWKREEQRKLSRQAIERTQVRLTKSIPPIEQRTYPRPTIEMADEQDEDCTCYPIPDWYPPDAIIITAKEQKDFEDYVKKLLANPTSRIHKTMKRLSGQTNNIDIDKLELDTDDDNSLLISYIRGETTDELNDVWINSTMSHSQAFAAKYEGNVQDEQIDLIKAVPSEFHDYLDIFSDEKSTRFPKSTPWDHKIKMKEGFQPKSF